MDKKNRAILYGLALGDGHISVRDRLKDGKYPYTAAELVIAHSTKQEKYLDYKRNLLKKVFGGKEPGKTVCKHNNSNGRTYTTVRSSKSNTYFRQMHKVLYNSEGQKVITNQALSYLDEHSVALWFCDDGTMRSNYNKAGEITSLCFELVTHCSLDEAQLICDWLKLHYGVECRPFQSKGTYCIRGGTNATLRLTLVIEPYIIPEMFYKIEKATRFVFRKSAQHPNFKLDDDIVQSLGKTT